MAPIDAPSPTPSSMPPPNNKRNRPRPSNPATTTTVQPRAKRRKAEGNADQDTAFGDADKSGKPVTLGTGMVKGGEEEWGPPGDVQTKIDFNELPVETLYKYLEAHDLLPRWDVSPWSEKPCTPPNSLYSIPPLLPPPLPPPPPAIPAVASPTAGTKSPTPPRPIEPEADSETTNYEPHHPPVEGGPDVEHTEEDPRPAPPTTRSKTAPSRRPPTPSPPSPPQTEVKRGVITLSDVLAARGVLAEKANTHWVKGLGGGQNKEGETIVQFLYKMKVGHGKLLRVYNPHPASYP